LCYMSNSVIGLIPAYKPPRALLDIVQVLCEHPLFLNLYVVDDGSGKVFSDVFDEVEKMGATMLRHAENKGKGAALRTGFDAIIRESPDALGVVTIDADGQHKPDDVTAVASMFRANPKTLVIGSRAIPDYAPLRNRLGNRLTRKMVKWFMGIDLSDTQSGLRGIPLSLLPMLLELRTHGYDFELDMLMVAKQKGTALMECPIAGVYTNGNETSHFRPLQDSAKIYSILLRSLFRRLQLIRSNR